MTAANVTQNLSGTNENIVIILNALQRESTFVNIFQILIFMNYLQMKSETCGDETI